MATLLYIDGENLQFSLHDQYGVDLDPHTLLALAWTVGPIQEARFYADFSIFPRQVALKAYAAGITLIHIPGYPSGNGESKPKSTTDQRLSLDCLERILTGPLVEAVIVASGDRGYVHLLEKLRRRDCTRIVLGVEETTSWWLKMAADKFLAYPIPEASPTEGPIPPMEEGAGSTDPRPLTEEDRRILLETVQHFPEPVPFIPLFKALQEQKRAGRLSLSNRQLKRLIEAAIAEGLLLREERNGIAVYRLLDEPVQHAA